MNYYYSEGNAAPQGPYSKAELIEFYNEGVITAECLICPEGSQSWYSISTILSPEVGESRTAPASYPMQTRMTLPAPNVPVKSTQRVVNGHAAREYLKKVRADSCYSTLRSVITILAALSLLSLFGSVILIALGANQEGLGGGAPILVAVAAAVLGSILIIASRQAALVLIDLADTQIEKNSQL